jgi:hypothetical protein
MALQLKHILASKGCGPNKINSEKLIDRLIVCIAEGQQSCLTWRKRSVKKGFD